MLRLPEGRSAVSMPTWRHTQRALAGTD